MLSSSITTSTHFIKHLSRALSLRCFHRFTPQPRFFFFFFLTAHQPIHTRFASSSSSSSSSYSSSSSSSIPSFTHSPYLSAHIHCHRHVADLLSEALISFGASSTTIDEQDDNESSDEVCISSIFLEGHDVKLCVSQAADSIGLKEIPRFEVSPGEQYDWVTKTQESFNPVEVTEGLWIVPEWRVPPDVEATNIMLNPGLAFGTGQHPTTKLCLLLLHGSVKGGESFLDYGTGSGVLAIAALKLGCFLSAGIDIDPQAIASARQNAVLNNIGPEKLQLYLAPGETMDSKDVGAIRNTEKYDMVIANILLNPLLDLAESIVFYGKPGAIIGLSGILSEQVPYILDRYSQFLEGISVTEMGDWACVCGTKKRNPTD